MNRPDADTTVAVYGAVLADLDRWIGCGSERRVRDALKTILEDEDAGWGGELREVLSRMLYRVVGEGRFYEGLVAEDRYYLTQVLIDLADEFLEQEPLSPDIPFDRLARELDRLPPGVARDLPGLLIGGREWGTCRRLWTPDQPFEPAYLGYLRREEVEQWLAALPAAPGGSGGLAPLRRAAEQAVELELDLVSYVS